MENIVPRLLNPGIEITDDIDALLGYPGVILVGNSRLDPKMFSLRSVDCLPIGELDYPGKSCMFDFLNLCNTPGITENGRDVVTQRAFGKDSDRRDCVYVATLDSIHSAGYLVFYAPVRTNVLHLRLVYGEHVELTHSGSNQLLAIPEGNLRAIAAVWNKATLVRT